jgi:ADP-ribose pyrophosphatase
MSDRVRYRQLGRRLACENRLFNVYFDAVETPGGEVVHDFIIVRPKVAAPGGIVGVCVLPEVDGRIGLMRGYRHQLDDDVWQAPAGFVEPGESADQSAMRELGEETGLTCDPENLQQLGVYYPDAGLIEGSVALFAAHNCRPTGLDVLHHEIGASSLQFFEPASLTRFVREAESVGGSTLVACFRYLATR